MPRAVAHGVVVELGEALIDLFPRAPTALPDGTQLDAGEADSVEELTEPVSSRSARLTG